MKALVSGLAALWLSASVPGAAFAHESEERGQSVTVGELPAPVKATFDKEAKGGQLEELRKDTKSDGHVVYRGEVVKNGKGTELEVSNDGKIMHRSKTHDESQEGKEGKESRHQ